MYCYISLCIFKLVCGHPGWVYDVLHLQHVSDAQPHLTTIQRDECRYQGSRLTASRHPGDDVCSSWCLSCQQFYRRILQTEKMFFWSAGEFFAAIPRVTTGHNWKQGLALLSYPGSK